VFALPWQRREGRGNDRLGCWGVEGCARYPSNQVDLNDNFTVLGNEGVLIMLYNEGCQELSRLHDLAASHNAVVLEDVPKDVWKLAVTLVFKAKPNAHSMCA
jgi:hypothetical protein